MFGSEDAPPSGGGSDHTPGVAGTLPTTGSSTIGGLSVVRDVSALTSVGAVALVRLVSNVETTPSTSLGLPNANAAAFEALAGMSIVATALCRSNSSPGVTDVGTVEV